MKELAQTYSRHTPLPPTYLRLKEAGVKHLAETMSESSVKNCLSILNVFMRYLNKRDKDIIGMEFDVDFMVHVTEFKLEMQNEGKAERTIQDRCEILSRWKDLVIKFTASSELPAEFNKALAEAIYRRQITVKELSKSTGITPATLIEWMEGTTRPTRMVERQLVKLETALRLPVETFTKRMGFVIKRHQVSVAAKANKISSTSYAARLSKQRQKGERLNYLIEVPDAMKDEWRQLIKHKISTVREHASANDVWRVRSRNKIGSKPKWCALTDDGQVVPTADACWSFLCRYFSWCALKVEHGGAGYTVERINSLAWILNEKLVKTHLQWLQQRSGNILHAGITSFLQLCCMLLRPNTGWLWLNPQLSQKLDAKAQKICLGFDPAGMDLDELREAWQQRCADVWKVYYKDEKFLSGHKSLKKSRDPKEPIIDILAHPRPLSVVMDMLATLKKNPPLCLQTKRYAVWTRDVLLIAWLTANPLRVSHFATMTYRKDNTGSLYQHEDASWHYRCGLDDFKNSPAKYMNTSDGQFDIRLPEYVGGAIELYLREGRPMLAGAYEGDFLFLPEKFANQTAFDRTGEEVPIFKDRWNTGAIGTRVKLITRGLRVDKPGFGPHAFRHIVATDYLKRFPGAYKLVADLLCDQLQTVIKEYGHTSAQDGLDLHYVSAGAEYDAAMRS